MNSLTDIINEAPKMIQKLSAVYKEMNTASSPMKGYPDETADYWSEKESIVTSQGRLETLATEIDKVDEKFAEDEETVESLINQSKNNDNI